MKRDMRRGISVCNPVDVEPEYFLYTIDYAIKNVPEVIKKLAKISPFQKELKELGIKRVKDWNEIEQILLYMTIYRYH